MRIKLRELNGSYYLLIRKDIRELLNIKNEIELSFNDGKLVIENIKKNQKRKIKAESGET